MWLYRKGAGKRYLLNNYRLLSYCCYIGQMPTQIVRPRNPYLSFSTNCSIKIESQLLVPRCVKEKIKCYEQDVQKLFHHQIFFFQVILLLAQRKITTKMILMPFNWKKKIRCNVTLPTSSEILDLHLPRAWQVEPIVI